MLDNVPFLFPVSLCPNFSGASGSPNSVFVGKPLTAPVLHPWAYWPRFVQFVRHLLQSQSPRRASPWSWLLCPAASVLYDGLRRIRGMKKGLGGREYMVWTRIPNKTPEISFLQLTRSLFVQSIYSRMPWNMPRQLSCRKKRPSSHLRFYRRAQSTQGAPFARGRARSRTTLSILLP